MTPKDYCSHGSSSKASGKGINHTSHGGESTLGVAEGVTVGEAEATGDHRVGAFTMAVDIVTDDIINIYE